VSLKESLTPEARQSIAIKQRSVFKDIYGDNSSWFTESFDTRDLKEAKALREELAT
jgi:hypothetical protein